MLPWAPCVNRSSASLSLSLSHQARPRQTPTHTQSPDRKITRLELCCRLDWWKRLLSPLYPHILILPSAVKEAALIRLIITWMICSGGEECDTKLLVCVCVCSLIGHTPSLMTLTRESKSKKKKALKMLCCPVLIGNT